MPKIPPTQRWCAQYTGSIPVTTHLPPAEMGTAQSE
jgi:hypothetical protein